MVLSTLIKNYAKSSSGGSYVEYAVMLASMGIGLVVTMGNFQDTADGANEEMAEIISRYPIVREGVPLEVPTPTTPDPVSPTPTTPTNTTPSRTPTQSTHKIVAVSSNLDDVGYANTAFGATAGREGSATLGSINSDGTKNGTTVIGDEGATTSDSPNLNNVFILDFPENDNKTPDDPNKAGLYYGAASEEGVPYVLSFDLRDMTRLYSRNWNGVREQSVLSSGESVVDIIIDGVVVATIDPTQNWERYSIAFLGTGSHMDITFAERDLDSDPNTRSGIIMDNVTWENGFMADDGETMDFSNTSSAADEVLVTFGDQKGETIDAYPSS